MILHAILNGHLVEITDWQTWAEWFENTDRHVALDTVGDVRVSTVFLGLDHSFGGGPPLWFETMVFGGEHSDFTQRYATWEEAEAGHQMVLIALRSKVRTLEAG